MSVSALELTASWEEKNKSPASCTNTTHDASGSIGSNTMKRDVLTTSTRNEQQKEEAEGEVSSSAFPSSSYSPSSSLSSSSPSSLFVASPTSHARNTLAAGSSSRQRQQQQDVVTTVRRQSLWRVATSGLSRRFQQQQLPSPPLPLPLPPPPPRATDRFGFFLDTAADHHPGTPGEVHTTQRAPRREEELTEAFRAKKWLAMLRDWDRVSSTNQALIKRRVRKGIPDCLRGKVWPLLCGAIQRKQSHPPTTYATLLTQQPSRADMLCISLDLPRTYPNHVQFTTDNGTFSEPATPASSLRPDASLASGQASLKNVLRAFAVYTPAVGYCQGMAFVAGLLVTYMPEEDAFWTLVSLVHDPLYSLAGMYSPGLPRFHEVMYIFGQLAKQYTPALSAHLETVGVDHAMYASQWFITIFTYSFPFDVVTRVWDMFYFEGWKAVYRTALAVLKVNEAALLTMEFDELMSSLKTLASTHSASHVIKTALSIRFPRSKLAKLALEYRTIHADEIAVRVQSAKEDAARKERMLEEAEAQTRSLKLQAAANRRKPSPKKAGDDEKDDDDSDDDDYNEQTLRTSTTTAAVTTSNTGSKDTSSGSAQQQKQQQQPQESSVVVAIAADGKTQVIFRTIAPQPWPHVSSSSSSSSLAAAKNTHITNTTDDPILNSRNERITSTAAALEKLKVMKTITTTSNSNHIVGVVGVDTELDETSSSSKTNNHNHNFKQENPDDTNSTSTTFTAQSQKDEHVIFGSDVETTVKKRDSSMKKEMENKEPEAKQSNKYEKTPSPGLLPTTTQVSHTNNSRSPSVTSSPSSRSSSTSSRSSAMSSTTEHLREISSSTSQLSSRLLTGAGGGEGGRGGDSFPPFSATATTDISTTNTTTTTTTTTTTEALLESKSPTNTRRTLKITPRYAASVRTVTGGV